MKQITILLFILLPLINIFGQNKTPKEYGYVHLEFDYKSDKVDILIKSKEGEENISKPLFFFCQGSMPNPLIKYYDNGVYGVFPFKPDSLIEKYHLVIVGKPYIPLMCDIKELNNNFNYIDRLGRFPEEYSKRNLLDYYVHRNIEIIKNLRKQKWVSKDKIVVAGHSEGSTIAAKMASIYPKITHLIYSGGNPMGRILSMIQQERANEFYGDSIKPAENEIEYWKYVVNDKTNMDSSQGDTNRATYEFSLPPMHYMEKLKIPVLICYGTKDWSAPYNDLLRVDVIRKKKKNFRFNAYIGTEHNFFPLTPENKPNYDIFNWDKVANDWLEWLNNN